MGGAAHIFAACFVVTLVVCGCLGARLPLTLHDGIVTVGDGEDHTVILVDRQVLGPLYGHALRAYLAKNPGELSTHSFSVIDDARVVVSPAASRLLVCGRWASSVSGIFHRAQSILLVNPSALPEDLNLSATLLPRTSVYFGEYADTPSRSSWLNLPGPQVRQIDGASLFIPDWPGKLLKPDHA